MEYLKFLVEEIHTTVMATVDDEGLPVTAAIDIMDYDESGLYFLTARGKDIYQRLVNRSYISLTGIKGTDTMSSVALSIRGEVREVGAAYLPRLFAKNPYMAEVYPTEESRKALTVFKLCAGSGEWFDLSKRPIERITFLFGDIESVEEQYRITDACTECGACLTACPQSCITEGQPYTVQQIHCLHCGNCLEICPVNAVEKQGRWLDGTILSDGTTAPVCS